MHSATTTAKHGALGLLACLLADGCDNWPAQGGETSPGPSAPPPPSVGMVCSSSTTFFPNASPEVNGAFCFGVALTSSELLNCVQVGGNETQCVDDLTGLSYVVAWAGTRGTVYGAGQLVIGAVERLRTDSYEIQLVETQGAAANPAGVCMLNMTSQVGFATFCAYEP